MNEEQKPITPPYVGYETFKRAIRGLADAGHLPDRIDNTMFSTMGGSSRAQFMQSLKFFELIDEKGTPSKTLRDLVSADDAQWKSQLKAILQNRYQLQLQKLETGTEGSFKDSFGSIGGIVTPAARFLLAAARDAGLRVSGHIKVIKAGDRKKRRPVDPPAAVDESGDEDASGSRGKAPTPTTGDAFTDALLSKFPAFNPAWNEQMQERWFKAYEQLLTMKKGGS